ncbi:histidine kinase [Longispora fulva]|uniref:histidine kinase n=1 Tax=Longispora fulva TaxID=619741 RepID=A0A8J7GPF8_9ACTN|nr:sensor histidine kinase [Longispora fulva]MBG6134431.1 signal transduction histidine kinase [Longispora fulva]GIG62653.1 histidine kinase [Longispora fulva]
MSTEVPLWPTMAHPVRFLRSWWPWRCLAYLVTTPLIAAAGLLVAVPTLVLVGVPVGRWERRRLRLLHPAGVPDPHGPTGPGRRGWLGTRLREGATWRELGYTLCLLTVLPVADLIGLAVLAVCLVLLTLPVFVVIGNSAQLRLGKHLIDTFGEAVLFSLGAVLPLTVLVAYGLCVLAGAQAAFARWLLAPTEAELGRQVRDLARSRDRLVAAFEAERRRIERDLHDGAQQQLVLLGMSLGLAARELGPDAGRAGELVGDAHRQARQALTGIRELVRGIHPQLLTDHGLAAAVEELAERCPVPMALDIRLDARPSSAVESTAYFVVSEAVSNAVRHAAAERITVSGERRAGLLVLDVVDDGAGGADPAAGTGLQGLADRAAVLDGRLTVLSPVGGPTSVRVELPWHCG